MRWKAFPDCYQSSAPIRLDRSAETSCRSSLCLQGVVQLDCIANGGEDEDDDDLDEDED